MGMKGVVGVGGGGEIVQVQGGHIVRSTGRKDRHSKVYTAKGPRDRRVRLSAHTAIQFYDVQDRLGYDRPSKAVDWLIKKAKSAIDKLAELPPWHPTGTTQTPAEPDPHAAAAAAAAQAGTSEMGIASAAEQSESSEYNFQLQRQLGDNSHSSFIPPPLDSDAIADTMKSFFPTSSAAASSMNFQSYPQDMIQRAAVNPTQDLGLSLHSFQDQRLVHGQSPGDADHAPPNDNHHHHHAALFGGGSVGFGSNYQRMVAWNSEASAENRGGGGGGNGFSFGSPPLQQQQQQSLLGQGSTASFNHQRGTLQSSFSPLVRAWDDLPMASQRSQQPIHQSSIFGTRFVSDGMPVFCMPARIHGQEDDDNDHGGVVSERPSSSSSPNSTHH